MAEVTVGKLKQNASRQHSLMLLSFVRNSFIKNLFILIRGSSYDELLWKKYCTPIAVMELMAIEQISVG